MLSFGQCLRDLRDRDLPRCLYGRCRIDLREIAAYFRNAAGDVVAEATTSKITDKIERLASDLRGSGCVRN